MAISLGIYHNIPYFQTNPFVASCRPSALLKLPRIPNPGNPGNACNILQYPATYGAKILGWLPLALIVGSLDCDACIQVISSVPLPRGYKPNETGLFLITHAALPILWFRHFYILYNRTRIVLIKWKQQTRTPVQAMQWMPGWMPRLFVDLLLQRRATA